MVVRPGEHPRHLEMAVARRRMSSRGMWEPRVTCASRGTNGLLATGWVKVWSPASLPAVGVGVGPCRALQAKPSHPPSEDEAVESLLELHRGVN